MFVIPLRVPFLSPTCESLHCASFIYLPPSHVTRIVCLARHSSICLRVRHPVARPLSISYLRVIALRVLHLFVSFSCHSDCLSCASFIYLSPCSSSCCASPFYLLLVSHCIARPSSICFRCRHSVDCTCASVVCCLRALLFCCTPRAPRGGRGIRLAGELGG
jgi:hypothetical protein